MADIVRQLTQDGIDSFRDYIEATRRGENPGPMPSHLLYRSPYSESLGQIHIEIEKGQFVSKYEAAVYFSEALKGVGQDAISYNGGLWSWLGLYYLDELSKSNANGTRQLKSAYCYILEVERGNIQWRRYTDHLLATPFYVYKRHGENARMLLTGSVASYKKFTREIVIRQQFSRSREFIKLVNRLYSDSNGNPKSGSVSKKTGSLFRLFAVIQQLEFTYDIFNMTCEQMLKLLPPEFDKWLNSDNRIPLRETGR